MIILPPLYTGATVIALSGVVRIKPTLKPSGDVHATLPEALLTHTFLFTGIGMVRNTLGKSVVMLVAHATI